MSSSSSYLTSSVDDGSGSGSVSEPDMIGISAKVMAVEDGTEYLSKCQDDMLALQQEMYDYKRVQADRMAEMREKVTELSESLKNTGKRMVSQTEKELKAVDAATAPYRNGPKTASTEALSVTDRCIFLLGKIAGVEASIKKTGGLSSIALHDHHELAKIEQLQSETQRRHEQLERVQSVLRELRPDDELFSIARLGLLLMALQKDANILHHYKHVFQTIQSRLYDFMAQIRAERVTAAPAPPTCSISSLSNGEIDLRSLQDVQEIPMDSLMDAF